ncbi:MAG: hypothetical protein JW849_07760 [Phycisphaerae bacterium]|nr:hypothetical protein [Phycisphaerae bacterium]
MTKRQLIDEILERNATADPEFLARFEDSDLDAYLANLRRLRTPRLSGDASRYEKYFAFNVPAKPIPLRADVTAAPCLPEEEDSVDDSFWHLDQPFESDDEELRQRVDRFAEQLLHRMHTAHAAVESFGADESDETCDDDGDEPIVYHHAPSFLADDEFDEPLPELNDEALQKIGASASRRQDDDSWLF